MNATLRLCELKPNAGETKRCIRSAEDLIDFSVSKLGRLIKVRTTENTNGSGMDVMLDKVRAVAGGKAIDTVSCHQAFYPYLVYLCHALPNARVYEVDILDTETKAKMNRGSAICHLDTSSWSSNHSAFSLLGSAPGEIERKNPRDSPSLFRFKIEVKPFNHTTTMAAINCARRTLQLLSTRSTISNIACTKSSVSQPLGSSRLGSSRRRTSNSRSSIMRMLNSSRVPVELGAAGSLMALHSVTASALYTSLLSLYSGSWGCLSEGT
ncbi:Polygalacturonase-1 non-catalytic subunit beta-like protein [Drosera capensis]